MYALISDKLAAMERRRFGASSERFVDDGEQLSIFNEAETEGDPDQEEPEYEEILPKKYKRKKRTGKKEEDSSLNAMTPEERFFSEPEQIRRISKETIEQSFLFETERRVTQDNVISINKIAYEIDDRYAKQKIRIRYSTDFQKVFVVEPSGELTPILLRPLNKQENADIKRQRFRFSDREEKEQ